jgi:hypothetical protein
MTTRINMTGEQAYAVTIVTFLREAGVDLKFIQPSEPDVFSIDVSTEDEPILQGILAYIENELVDKATDNRIKAFSKTKLRVVH